MQIIDNKNILKCYIGDKQVIKKYIGNQLVYGQPDFASYYNFKTFNNYTVVGSPTIVDNVASGFSGSNYLQTNNSVNVKNITETNFRIFIDETQLGDNQNFYLFQQKILLQIFFNKYQTYGTQLSVYVGGANHTTSRIIPMNTWIDISTTYNGDTFKAFLATNGIKTEILSFALDLSSLSEENPCTFGRNQYSADNYFRGLVDLNNTYIKVNGKMWLNGNPNYKEIDWANPNLYLENINASAGYFRISDIYNIQTDKLKFNFLVNSDTTGAQANQGPIQAVTSNVNSNILNISRWYMRFNGLRGVPNFTLGQKISFEFIKDKIYQDGSLLSLTTEELVNTTGSFIDYGRSSNGQLKGKLYALILKRNNNEIYHLVPVPAGLQIGYNKILSNGMYDIVNQVFYPNQGIGNFIFGVDQ